MEVVGDADRVLEAVLAHEAGRTGRNGSDFQPGSPDGRRRRWTANSPKSPHLTSQVTWQTGTSTHSAAAFTGLGTDTYHFSRNNGLVVGSDDMPTSCDEPLSLHRIMRPFPSTWFSTRASGTLPSSFALHLFFVDVLQS
jgi:hypothetical protein